MAFSIFGKNKTKSLDSIAAIIRDVENSPFGVSECNVLYAGLNELGGYHFFQTVIVGQLYVKTKNGAELLLKGENFELKLKADMSEFESDPSDIATRNITKIDFQIEESEIEKLQNAKLTSIIIKVKKQDIVFTKLTVSDEEE